jgi:hypothetical protein
VIYRSDKAEGPTAGTERVDPLEFLARLVTHIPEPGQVMQRYYGWYASRTRGLRRRQANPAAEAPVAIVDPVDWSLRAARFRWAELLRRISEVDPLACSRCQGLMRIVAVITDPAVITRILTHRARARDPTHRSRSPPLACPGVPAAAAHRPPPTGPPCPRTPTAPERRQDPTRGGELDRAPTTRYLRAGEGNPYP